MNKVQKNKKTIITALLAGIMAIGGLLWHNNHGVNDNSDSDDPKKAVVEEEHQNVENTDTTAVWEQPVAEQNAQQKSGNKGIAQKKPVVEKSLQKEKVKYLEPQDPVRPYNLERNMSLSTLEQRLKDLDTTMANLQQTIESEETDPETHEVIMDIKKGQYQPYKDYKGGNK